MIRTVLPGDAESIARIYNYYVLNTIITFEEVAVSLEEMQGRIEEVSAVYPWLVYEHDGKVAGYAYATRWKQRAAYRFAVESTIYLDQDFKGLGFGRQLYTALIDALRSQGIHTVIGGAALPNDASIKLHEALGFTKVAQFSQVGWKFGRWIDVGYWQLVLGRN